MLMKKGKEVLKKAGEAVVTGSATGSEAVRTESEAMVQMANTFSTAHEDRLVTGECSPKSSSNYLCILYAFEDVASHTKDVLRKMSQQ